MARRPAARRRSNEHDSKDEEALSEQVDTAGMTPEAPAEPEAPARPPVHRRDWPIEFVPPRPGQQPPAVHIFRVGMLRFEPLKEGPYKGRHIEYLANRDQVAQIIREKNRPGAELFIEPADVISDRERKVIEQIVDERLKHHLKT